MAQQAVPDIQYSNHRWLPGYDVRKIGNTIILKGNNKRSNYFEGWYFKMVAADSSAIMSVIPGIALSRDGKEQHAFIQIINGKTAQTSYFTFPVSEFGNARHGFGIRIGNNYFSGDSISLDLHDNVTTLKGSVTMHNKVEYNTNELQFRVSDDKKVSIRIKNRHHIITIDAESKNTGILPAPVQGSMETGAYLRASMPMYGLALPTKKAKYSSMIPRR